MNKTWAELQNNISYCNFYKVTGSSACTNCRNHDCSHNNYTDKQLEKLWNELGDIPIHPETEELEQPFIHFPIGTDKEEIWHWFDKRYSKGVVTLLYGK